jgi:hypothetical protein
MEPAEALPTINELEDSMWGKRIVAANARGYWNSDDMELAGSWKSCACGQMDPWIELDPGSRGGPSPKDVELYNLGCEFARLRTSGPGDYNMFDRAARLLIAIHNRSMELYVIAKQKGEHWTTRLRGDP